MSEELKPCPFCGAKPHRQLGKIWHDSLHGDTHQDTVIKCPHLCVTMQGSEDSVVERWNTRADLLPVVKPLVWEEHCEQTGGCHSISAYNPKFWGYVIEAPEPGGPFGIWSPDEGEGVDDPRLGLDYPTIEAAMAAAQADYDACSRARLDMIDPTALVAGAYEAAAGKLAKAAQAEAEINNPHDAELLWHMEKRIRALTPADAQAALDAAIAKAVNEKLERALNSILFEAEAYREMGFLDAAQSLNMIAGDIFEMTEPE